MPATAPSAAAKPPKYAVDADGITVELPSYETDRMADATEQLLETRTHLPPGFEQRRLAAAEFNGAGVWGCVTEAIFEFIGDYEASQEAAQNSENPGRIWSQEEIEQGLDLIEEDQKQGLDSFERSERSLGLAP